MSLPVMDSLRHFSQVAEPASDFPKSRAEL